jgi:hypothetical protein
VLALAQRLLAEADVLGALDALDAALAQALQQPADALGHRPPGEVERQRQRDHQRGDPQHTRAGEAQRGHAGRAERVAEHAARMAARQRGLAAVQAGPFQRAARGEHQHDAQRGEPARTLRVGQARRRQVGAQPARQGAEPGPAGNRQKPPGRVAEQEQRDVGEPGADHADAVVQLRAEAGGGPCAVRAVVGGQGEQRQQPQHAAEHHRELQAPARHTGRRRCAAVAQGGRRRRAQGTERKTHAPDCRRGVRRAGGGRPLNAARDAP